MTARLAAFQDALESPVGRVQRFGSVVGADGLTVKVHGISPRIGDVLCSADGAELEVVALHGEVSTCMPLTNGTLFQVGQEVESRDEGILAPYGQGLLGRVLDGLGNPIDGLGPLAVAGYSPVEADAPHPMGRARIREPLETGVRVLDAFTTLGKGQRIGLFAGSGVGKSTLLSMVARGTESPLSVICLIGERGREVLEFIEDDLGPEGLARSVVVVATSDQPAPARIKAAFLATRIAESFREQGQDVVLMMDSLTRVALAQREIGLSAGEPPATRGFPPSTFRVLAQLLERAGSSDAGSITGIYTVLVDGDDHNDPVADAARGILDGHIVMDRRLANAGHYPAVDSLASISRVATKVLTREQVKDLQKVRAVMAARQEKAELIDVGMYSAGTMPLVDLALKHEQEIADLVTQGVDDVSPFTQTWEKVHALARAFES